ncbi:SIS domain-containing protein [Micromonospora sp. WMMD882]|uniref:SIS domain-containing protein n=1 Tax=Micromonospora sp. WMMD882 TaxID=3015151 RepID=UPI00248C0B8A|nr:SIS domain-containing protein [Micromonospora sp. WMMD882]WBB78463.1 SIS domain-containing protein [Micromonospora sp. WMMD882]
MTTDLIEPPAAEYGEPNRVSVDDMMYEIAHQSYAVLAAIEVVEEQVARLPEEKLRDARHVYVTGCGDSYFAGIAARMAFHRFAKVPTEPIEALEFARYAADALPDESLVLAISNSGKATRTVEAAARATDVGAFSVAVTGSPTSRLAEVSRHTLNQRVEREGRALTMPSNLEDGAGRPSFGLANYLVSFTTLLLVALRMGRLRGHLSEAEVDEITEQMRAAARAVDQTVEICADPADKLAQRFAEHSDVMIVGGGPAHGMALFYGAKTYELARINGNVQHLEEWAHEQFFLTGSTSELLLLAPPGRSSSRAEEILRTAAALGAHCAVVTVEEAAASFGEAGLVLPVAGNHREELIGIPYVVPGELFATRVAAHRGHDAFEFDSELQYVLNMKTIQESRIYRPQQR